MHAPMFSFKNLSVITHIFFIDLIDKKNLHDGGSALFCLMGNYMYPLHFWTLKLISTILNCGYFYFFFLQYFNFVQAIPLTFVE